jgi:FAD/FMN-containing dehydrogenase
VPSLDDLADCFSGRLLTAAEDMAPFLTDWRDLWRGSALAVVQPDSADDVASVVRWCAARGIAIVPQGGNTGMSGGATPEPGANAIILSLARMNRIRTIDGIDNVIVVDAGCILHTVQQAAEDAGRFFPLSLGAEGSCTIGGNLATNAGGTGVLRYGSARDLCLGMEVVTAQGLLWDGLRRLRKDSSGYDLRDLFIGSEGTLGIITGAVMRLYPSPAARATALVAVPSIEAALELFDAVRNRLDTALTAFEFLSENCLSLVLDHRPDLRRPIQQPSPWYLLVELSDLQTADGIRDVLESLLATAFEQDLIVDAAIAETVAQARDFWAIREGIAEAQGRVGKTIKHDIAVPVSRVPAFLSEADAAIGARWPDVRFVTFGHLGDGNIHYNFSPPDGGDQQAFLAQQQPINQVVHDIVVRHGGTISAEHGLGQLRNREIARYKSPIEIELMRQVKQALDPQGLMNPGKLLP